MAFRAEQQRYREMQQAEARRQLEQSQAATSCLRSEECASGFVCAGGRCVRDDYQGSTISGGTGGSSTGCGAGIGGDEGYGGAGDSGDGGSGGCGGNTGGTGGSSGGFWAGSQTCGSTSAGDCRAGSIAFGGPGLVDSRGGGGGDCGKTCCRCGTGGCACYAGDCPPPRPSCSRFCTEAKGAGVNVKSCGPKECDRCEYCDDSGGEAECKRRSYDSDCACDGRCTGCDTCSPSGNCLTKPCPPPPPKEEPEGEEEELPCKPTCANGQCGCDNSGSSQGTDYRCYLLASDGSVISQGGCHGNCDVRVVGAGCTVYPCGGDLSEDDFITILDARGTQDSCFFGTRPCVDPIICSKPGCPGSNCYTALLVPWYGPGTGGPPPGVGKTPEEPLTSPLDKLPPKFPAGWGFE